MKSKILVLLLSSLTFSFAFANSEEVIAAKEQVNSACATDAQAAGCTGEKVGYGLLKCLHDHKKAHKDFKFTDGCKASMKTLKTEKTEAKAEKAAAKGAAAPEVKK